MIVIAIALETGDPTVVAFQRAAQGVLGPDVTLVIETAASDPPDAMVASRSASASGVVELTLSDDRERAHLHCYVTKEHRWIDREVVFGPPGGPPTERDAAERGRLLGFAAATMFSDDGDTRPVEVPLRDSENAAPRPPSPAVQATPGAAPRDAGRAPAAAQRRMSFEFAGIASSGIGGTASGLGATAGLRFDISGPFAGRGFLAGRAGSIPEAQATTRTLEVGAGLAVRLLPQASRWLLGVRADGMVSYFEAEHFSSDDPAPDRQARFLPGADLLLESGFRLSDAISLYAGAGVAAMFGTTGVYTHGAEVAVVPAFRAVGELGLRASF